MNPTIVESIHETLKRVRAEIARLQAMESNLAQFEKGEGDAPPVVETPRQEPKKRRRAPTGALPNAILDALKSGPKTNAQLREHIKASGYIYSLEPEVVRQACHKLKKERPAKIKATGEGQGMKYALAK